MLVMRKPEEDAKAKPYSFTITNNGTFKLAVCFEVSGVLVELEVGESYDVVLDKVYDDFRPDVMEWRDNTLIFWCAWPSEIYRQTANERKRIL